MIEFTKEQEIILSSNGSIRVHAVAGSGKTTTLIEYAKRQPKNKRILYLAFNRSVKDEAIARFETAGLSNVSVETAHSLAFFHVVRGSGFTVASHSPLFILKLLSKGSAPTADALSLMAHVQKYATWFCNERVTKVEELNYLSIVKEREELDFVEKHRDEIIMHTRRYLAEMFHGRCSITHDFYLKLFQLKMPRLQYDIILFDEAQDASPVMVDVIQKQVHIQKVIVGDKHQQIYRWRHAVNAMELFDYPVLSLSRSFRFGRGIASLAKDILQQKLLGPVAIVGKGNAKGKIESRAVLGRSNISLLAEAITLLEKKPKSKIWFEGHISSYLFGEEGGALSDVLNIHNDKQDMVKSEILQNFTSIDEVETFAKESGEKPLGSVVDIVKAHGKELPFKIAGLWKAHLTKEERGKADTYFSTVHRCKGLEYDEVYLCSDFVSSAFIDKELDKDDCDRDKLFEEINILYVAATRARKKVTLPQDAVPKAFQTASTSSVKSHASESSFKVLEQKKSPQKRRVKPQSAGRYWSREDEKYLVQQFEMGKKIKDIAQKLGRSRGSIVSRLQKIESDKEFYQI